MARRMDVVERSVKQHNYTHHIIVRSSYRCRKRKCGVAYQRAALSSE